MPASSYLSSSESDKEKSSEDSHRKSLLGYDKLSEVEGVICGERDLIFCQDILTQRVLASMRVVERSS